MGMKTQNRFFRGYSFIIVAVLLAALAGPLVVTAQVFTSDCTGSMEPKTVFDKNEPICITALGPFGACSGLSGCCADFYIMGNQSWSGGEALADVMGSENRICNNLASIVEEYIALPPLKVGQFDMVVDGNFNKIFDVNGYDDVQGIGPEAGFQVVDLGHPPVDMSPLKNAAHSISMGYADAIQQWNDAMAILDAASIGLSLMSGDVIGAAIGVASHFTGVPTDYNGWVIYTATELLGGYDPVTKKGYGIYGNMAKHWADLAADPPDANFTVFAPFDVAALIADLKAASIPGTYPDVYPIQPLGSDPREAALVKIANRGIEQGALVKAMRQSYEKYQGAAAVSNYEFAYRQLDAAKQFGELLAANLAGYTADLQYLKSVLVAQGVANRVVDVSGLQALKDRMNTTGITPEEITSLKAVGFSDTRITLLVEYTKTITVPTANYTLGNSIDALILKSDQTLAAIQTANVAALSTMATLAPDFTPHYPTARAGGPYTGVTGNQITLNGGLSTDPDVGDVLTYAWDLNGDGVYNDAAGQVIIYTWNKPFSGLIALKVTDQAGNSSIGYAKVTVSSGNLPPVISSFTPAETNPRASVLHPLTLSVTASDPEGGALTYEWTVDGIVSGTGSSFTLTPQPNYKGVKRVMVAVRDNQPNNPAAIDGRLVTVYIDCDPTDPTTMNTYYRDADGDGFGDPGSSVQACAAPAGYVTNNFDCNDANVSIGKPTQLFYLDADGDGFGNPSIPVLACSVPVGYVTNNLDCNDSNATIGQPSQTFYRDADGDGFGNPNVSVLACSQPIGYVTNSLDCDDTNPLIGNNISTFYQDADGDGYGTISVSVQACLQPAGYVSNGLDCNDVNPYVNPGRQEVVHNGLDDDCNAATMDNWSKSFVLAATDAGYIYYTKSNGDSSFGNYKQIQAIGGTSRGIVIEDFNGDGFLDYIVGRSDGAYLQFNNDGSDNFIYSGVVAQHPYNGCWSVGLSAGDFNNDGLMDFAGNNGCSNITAVFINDGKGGFTRSTYTLPATGRSLNVADIDGDGNLDFVVALTGNNDIWLFKGDGNGGFIPSKIATAPGSGNDNYALAAADFDNDGKVDIILGGSSNGNPYFFKGNGNGTFQPPIYVLSLDTDYYNAIDAYDLNNDGNVDIVLGDYNGANLYFYPGLGDGTFGPRVKISTSATNGAVLSIAAPPIGNPAGFPIADAEPKRQTIAVGGSATFDGSFSRDPGGSIVSYDWKFGDGATASGANPSHTFSVEGIFTPRLLVTDNDGKKAGDTAQVKVVGNPPVANAGGPYTFGEQYASGGVYTVPLIGTGSTDDFGIATYAWDFSPFSDAFNGTTLDSTKWIASTGVTQNGKISIVGASGWDTRYLFSQDTFNRENGTTVEMRVKPGTVDYQHAMFGVKNTNTNYSYTQMPHAFYFYQGNMYVYEDGSSRGVVSTYTRGVQYDLKLELKATGALYYMRETGKPNWQLIYTSTYSSLLPLKVGGTVYSDTFEVDDVAVHAVVYGPTPNKLLSMGTYPVTLTVTDKVGQQASDSTTITTVAGISPTANPGGPYLLDETKASQNVWPVTFDGSASTDDTGIETYSWNFGDGSALGSGVKPSHSYTGAGTYTVALTVTDRSGQANTATTTVTTKGNGFPVANPGGPYTVTEDQVINKHWNISVDASASTDDVGIWKYEWNFGDGTAVVTTKTATHTYVTPGTFTVTLKVTDNANQSHTATTTAAVVGTAAPTASPGGPYFTEPNTPVNFDGSGSTDNTGILSYAWNFGDGTTGKGAQPSHGYSSTGTYTVTLTVKDTALQTATSSTTVLVAVGNPPVADAGGPYAGNVGVPIRFNGSGSTDDFGIASYEWTVGSATILLSDSFTGTVIDPAKWFFPAAGVTQNNAVTLSGGGGWGNRYLFSKADFVLDGTAVVTGQINHTVGGYLMFGFKNNTTNYSYEQMPYALYLNNGALNIYESGASRGQFGTYSLNVPYDVKVELKSSMTGAVSGARYYYKPVTSSIWNLLYDSSYVPASTTFKAGASYYSGTFVIDNLMVASGSQTVSGEKPVLVPQTAGTYPVLLTVTDGAGQTSTSSSTLTVSSDPLVITAPWQFSGGVEIPHDTWSGKEVILKAVVKSGKAPITYTWDFGDGTASAPAPVTDSYNLAAKHTYTAADGTPITARITVTDADGKTSSDIFPIIVRPKTLNVEVNKSIDDALWYIHTSQNRTNGSWESAGYTGGYFASSTSSAIHSMEINGHLEVGDFSNDPYVEDVWRGMQFTLNTLNSLTIDEQAYGNPDVNGNGFGVQVNSSRPIYESGPVMMALVASGTPNMKAVTGGAGIFGRTYRDIVEDMAEMYFWGQNDDPVSGGAWQYSWNSGNDNSASQWAVLGLEAAEEQGWIKVPQWVRDRNIIWLATSRSGDGNGYGYTGSGNDVATTPSGLAQVAFNKIPTSDSRWKQVENFLASYWNNWYNGSGNYYSLYSMAKSLRTAKPKEVTILGEGTASAIDWYNDPTRGMARTIVNQQDANGMYTGGSVGGTHWAEASFRAAWGVIILTKTLFVLPPVAIAGDNKVWGVDWPLTFDGSKSYHLDPFRKIVKYEWDFNGDGVYDYSSDQPMVTHTYSSADYPVSSLPKTFKVTLRVTDNNDPPKYDTSTVSIVIAVPPHPPVAVPGGPYVGFVGIPLQFDGNASYDIDPTDIITAYGWELDGAYPYNFTDATGAKPTYIWNTPGTYNIGLQVTDNGVLSPGNAKLSDTKWTTVIIKQNHPPVANAGGPYTMFEGGSIQLDGSASIDPDGNPLIYMWDLDNDGIFETTGATPTFSRPDNGTFTVRLKVSDGSLESIASATVTVVNVAPVVNLLSPASINEGSTYVASGSFVDPGTSDTWTATVDYGDDSGVHSLPLVGKTFSLSHLYPQNGFYPVTVIVTDKDSGTGSTTTMITVTNVTPIVNAGPDVTLIDIHAFSSTGSFTDPGAEDTWTATVNYGDGTGVQALALNQNKTFALSHLYATNGSFTVTVAVTDSDGATGTDTAVVNINNLAPVVNAGPDAVLAEGSIFSSTGSFTDPSSVAWTATVNYGDGSGIQPLTLNGDKTFALNHLYSQDGAYTVTVRITDNDSAVGNDTVLVTVGNVAPVVNAGPDATISAGSSFNSSGSFVDPGADTWTATVNYGDGSGVQPLALNANKTFNLSHVFATTGAYTVSVTVQDNSGASGSDTAVVTVSGTTVSCFSSIKATPKSGVVQLNWTGQTGNQIYSIYRSTVGPDAGFTVIAANYPTAFQVYQDRTVVNGTTYFYKVELLNADSCMSTVVSAKPMSAVR
jgi:PKD repeat protein